MRQELKIACVEEVAYHIGYIDRERLLALTRQLGKSEYGPVSRKASGARLVIATSSAGLTVGPWPLEVGKVSEELVQGLANSVTVPCGPLAFSLPSALSI
jgi:hypothetical protein